MTVSSKEEERESDYTVRIFATDSPTPTSHSTSHSYNYKFQPSPVPYWYRVLLPCPWKWQPHPSSWQTTRQIPFPVVYDGIELDVGYRLDLLVEEIVIAEVKAVEQLLPIHTAQLLSYLRLSNRKLGYLFNFNTAQLRSGIKRVVNGLYFNDA